MPNTVTVEDVGSNPIRHPFEHLLYHRSLIGIEHKTFNLVDAGSSPVDDAKGRIEQYGELRRL